MRGTRSRRLSTPLAPTWEHDHGTRRGVGGVHDRDPASGDERDQVGQHQRGFPVKGNPREGKASLVIARTSVVRHPPIA
jgi:hypothetical protein